MTEYYHPTPADEAEASDYFLQMEYETRPRDVECSCGNIDRDSEMNLRRNGWKLKLGEPETCPDCITREIVRTTRWQ